MHEAVISLLEHSPAQLHLVLAIRSDPPSPSGLAAHLRVVQRDPSAERDAPDEGTGGWVAGLRLCS